MTRTIHSTQNFCTTWLNYYKQVISILLDKIVSFWINPQNWWSWNIYNYVLSLHNDFVLWLKFIEWTVHFWLISYMVNIDNQLKWWFY